MHTESTSEIPTALLHRLIECHRPTKEQDPFVFNGLVQYFVKCPACDGNRSYKWRPGEPEYECQIWRETKRYLDG